MRHSRDQAREDPPLQPVPIGCHCSSFAAGALTVCPGAPRLGGRAHQHAWNRVGVPEAVYPALAAEELQDQRVPSCIRPQL
jgi:hypothetical protein